MEQKEHRLAVIMFVDVCGFSSLIEKHEEETLQFLSDLTGTLETLAPDFKGKVIKSMGDAFLIDFKTTLDAVTYGIKIQTELAPNFAIQGTPVELRIGIHLGDIYFFKNDALGEGITIASRLQSICRPGRICMSGEVYNQVSGKIRLAAESLGKVTLKDVSREIDAYELVTAGDDRTREDRYEPAGPGEGEPVDFQELKDLVIDQIKHAGRRIREERHRHHVPHPPPPGRGRSRKNGNGEDSFGITEQQEYEDTVSSDDPYQAYRDYRHRVIRQAAMQKIGIVGHLVPYIAVNGFLIFLNLRFSPGFFWAAFPLCGWGIGILSHLSQVGVKNKQQNDVQRLPELKTREYRLLRKIHALRGKIVSHVASTIGVTILLSVINRMVSPGVFWAIIPIGAMSIGLISHMVRYTTETRVLKKEFKDRVFGDPGADFIFGQAGDIKTTTKPACKRNVSPDIVDQAICLREGIIQQLNGLEQGSSPVGEDMLPILDNYIEQIRELHQKNQELNRVLVSMPIGDLEKDRTVLQGKLESSNSEYLRKEYTKSIAEIERQVSSFNELKNQREVIKLRLSSAVNSLKQMQLDLARMKTMSTSNERASIRMLQEKSRELSTYLEDLKQSYQELDEDT